MDNCLTVVNAAQEDTNTDGVGDHCDPPLSPAARPPWGDCCAFFAVGASPAPHDRVDVISDADALLEKFRNTPTAPIKARIDLVGDLAPFSVLDLKINITDVTRFLDAFRGLDYPFTPSGATPCAAE